MIDDAWLCVEIVNELLCRRKKPPINIEKYRQRYELPVKNFYEKAGFDFSEESFEKIGAEFLEIYQNRQYECALQKGASGALNFFNESNLLQSVLSAYHQDRLCRALKHYRIKHYFAHICGRTDDYASGKIEIARELIRKLRCSVNQVLLIGDTAHDFEVAKTIGLECILVSAGHYKLKRLQFCEVPVLSSLSKLIGPGI